MPKGNAGWGGIKGGADIKLGSKATRTQLLDNTKVHDAVDTVARERRAVGEDTERWQVGGGAATNPKDSVT